MKIMQVITDYITKTLLTTRGDLVVRGAAVPERLAAGAVGTYLKGDGAGAKPVWAIPLLSDFDFASGAYGRNTAGDKVVTGLGFEPKLVILLARDNTATNENWSIGFSVVGKRAAIGRTNNGTQCDDWTAYSSMTHRDGSNWLGGVVSAVGADGFTVTYSLTGTVDSEVSWFAIG